MPAAFTFCIPKCLLITYSCSKQRSEALSCLSLNSSIYSGTLPSPPCLVWLLFAGLVQNSTGFIFIFIFFSDFQRCQVAMKNEDLVMTENLHDKFSYRIMKWILYYFFFLLHFFRGILWQFSSCISVLYYILNEYIEESTCMW